MIGCGTALQSSEPPHHRMVVLSDPAQTDGMVVLVRITTAGRNWPDEACFLDPSDWPELQHRSTVAYSTCKFGQSLPQLEAAILAGLLRVIPSPPPATIRRIIHAAQSAEGMPPGARKWLAAPP